MKQCVEVIKDSFTDYAGRVHHFVIAAVSEAFEVSPFVAVANDPMFASQIGTVKKGVRLGISICNPKDTFDEKVGVLKATARAKNSEISLYSSEAGQINTKLVRAFLEQEAEYLKNNPDKYIQGYSDSKERWLRNERMKEVGNNLTDVEKVIVEGVQKDSKFLDNVKEYLKWLNNKSKGKCKESGK